jgi:hypothetical protein
MNKINKNIVTTLDEFLFQEDKKTNQTIECKDDVCIIKNDKDLVEVVGKRIITQDGRQLLV